eukprot:Gb_33836 [translate_table: standard]
MADHLLLLLTLGVVCVALVVQLQRWFTTRVSPKKRDGEHHKLVPGSMGWPLIGETISWYLCMSNHHHPRHFVDERQRRYGDIFRSNLFGRKVIVSVDPHFNRYVMQNEGRLFEARYPKPFVELMGKYGLLTVHGELQRRLHGTAVNLLKIEKLRIHFMDDIDFILHNALSTWEGKNILLQEECHRASFMTLNMMAKQLLDLSPSKETDEIVKQFDDFSKAVLTLPVKIPGSKYARGIKARDFLKRKVYEKIEERRKNPQIVHNDLLTKLLNEETLSDEIVSDFLVFLLFAGHETSSRSMAFSIKFLTECPKALEQLREEHDALHKRKGNEKLTWDDYKSMKFTQCVVNETLRLGNIAPFVYREAKEDIKVKDYLIPKGSTIMAFISAVHVDNKYYPAALKFDPWRWEGYDQEVSNSPSYTPFGGGARLCPGAHLGRLEMALFLHHFLIKFRCCFFLRSDIKA